MHERFADRFLHAGQNQLLTKQEGNLSLLNFACLLKGCSPAYTRRYYGKMDFGSLAFFSQKKHGISFFSLQKYQETTRRTFSAYHQRNTKKSPNVQDFQKLWRVVDGLYSKFNEQRIRQLDEQALQKCISEILDKIARLLAMTVYTESLDIPQIQTYFRESGGRASIENSFLQKVVVPTFASFSQHAHKLLLKKYSNHDAQFLFSDYFSSPTEIQAQTRAHSFIRQKGGVQAMRQTLRQMQKMTKKSEQVIRHFWKKLLPQERKVFAFVQASIALRDLRKIPFNKLLVLLNTATREVLQRNKIPAQLSPYVFYAELEEGVVRQPSYLKVLRSRERRGVNAYFFPNAVHIRSGAYNQELKQLLRAVGSKARSTQLQGTTAFIGVVEGKVQRILSEKDFHRFRKGNILVTSMTRPEFVPLLKKSIAIITDEGGVTCHAAIISRELQIPCIVGTQIATRVLKDGMQVRVDAKHGVVQVLKNK
ncbi:MAG: PEP-utilizing enzyme [Patescibacteria group bacterium]